MSEPQQPVQAGVWNHHDKNGAPAFFFWTFCEIQGSCFMHYKQGVGGDLQQPQK